MTTSENKPHIERRGRVARAAPLVGLAGRTAGEAVVTSLRRKSRRDKSQFHANNAERYADHLGKSKGVLMKAGQILSFTNFASAVPDSSQSVYQRALARLQDSAPPMPAEMAAEVVEKELGGAPDKVFAEFDPDPIGAASIGQVHRGRLHDGRAVAIKVQYPGVDEAIRADLQNTELLATFLQVVKGFMPNAIAVDVRSVAAEVSERIGEEIDYLTEARNQNAFADGYRGHPFIRIPEIHPDLTTSRVLTMDFVEGRRFADAVTSEQSLRDSWGEVIMRFAVGSVRRLHLFHADPHPGNYLFHDDGSVTFLDFGCIKKLDVWRVSHMQAALNAAIDRDSAALFPVLQAMGFVPAGTHPDPDDLMEWFRLGLDGLTSPQPYTYSAAEAKSIVATKFSPVGPYGHVVKQLSLDPEYTMLSRIDLGMTSVLCALGSTGPWEAIRWEWDRGGPAATEKGVLDKKFWGDEA
ncbi:AarF/ABC1/UbiB kinase family protein [Antrihabitans sp. YC2-6]|uniref:ABC1 kinase family protein n=1 Tax=Antrihabitans sp. YC2-6 TaxID=2799498 RepID=UPI0018F7ABC5|nr:AarF/ABC1/UbiB kinase family protein [Antrihabitans sp. YC2-6]MBJ8343544.1 AarF/ABC1/UbiB kinase family protein [Antrihabitans sp. YC2-6]